MKRQFPSSDDAAVVLRKLELSVTRKLAGMLRGDYQGLLPGPGAEAGDTRLYEAGDDTRRIDWAATARSGSTQMRMTVEDRELTLCLVLDATGSMDFGSVNVDKRELAATAAAAFGFLAARGANRVGGGVLADRWTWFAPRSGRDTTRMILHTALTASRETTGSLADALERTFLATKQRSVVVVVSDFAGPLDFEPALRMLCARHDVIAVEIVDPREQRLTDVGVVAFEDSETGRQRWIDTSNSALRKAYEARREQQRSDLAELLKSANADHLTLTTGADAETGELGETWMEQLVAWLQLRRLATMAGQRR